MLNGAGLFSSGAAGGRSLSGVEKGDEKAMYERVLVAIDHSQASDRVLDAARDLAQLSSGEVWVLHVRERETLGKFAGAVDMETADDARHQVDGAVDKLAAAGVKAQWAAPVWSTTSTTPSMSQASRTATGSRSSPSAAVPGFLVTVAVPLLRACGEWAGGARCVTP
jgi:hypothetical protein